MSFGPNMRRRCRRGNEMIKAALILFCTATPRLGRSRNFARLLVVNISVDVKAEQGSLELWHHTLGQGGINSSPLPPRVIEGAKKLQPRLIRIFIQEFFDIYPDHNK